VSNRLAFSMIELVMVIVVISILASVSISNFDKNIRRDAIDSISHDIIYTQQLALLDNKHNINDSRWQMTYWKWRYTLCSKSDKVFYSVSSDMNEKGNVNRVESAIDTYNGKYLYQSNYFCKEGATSNKDDSSRVIISERFGIKSISNGGSCKGDVQSVAFDSLGRPHRGVESYSSPNYEFLMKKNCSFTFSFFDEDIEPFAIVIEAITGRVFLEEMEVVK